MDSARDSHASKLLGGHAFSTLQSSNVLVVGAGGIGCELLKNLVLSPFKRITVVDLDSIDLSNLNRQFLFRKHHINKSKAETAKQSVLKFNKNVEITAHYKSIFDSEFHVEWYMQFDVVLNALDNVAARKHVNQMCLAANVPLIESGTQGYEGQVTVHIPKKFQCFECEPAPTQKTFAICTIRSTPSAPIHCIVWAKNYLFNQLFGPQETEDPEISPDADSELKNELDNLKRESDALREIRSQISTPKFSKLVFQKVFHDDISRLASTESLWKFRPSPNAIAPEKLKKLKKFGISGVDRDHKVWSFEQNLHVFEESILKLARRFKDTDNEFALSFEKDDEEIMDFVAATANLRATVFGIETLSRFKIKEMAGQIIPAIATTNAIIAGMIVIQAVKVLSGATTSCKNTYLVRGGQKPLTGYHPQPPLLGCTLCHSSYFSLSVDTTKTTLQQFLDFCRREKEVNGDGYKGLGVVGDVEIKQDSRLLYDFDFDENTPKTLIELGISHGKRVSIVEDETNIIYVISVLHSDGEKEFLFKSPETRITIPPSGKRHREDVGGTDAKRVAV